MGSFDSISIDPEYLPKLGMFEQLGLKLGSEYQTKDLGQLLSAYVISRHCSGPLILQDEKGDVITDARRMVVYTSVSANGETYWIEYEIQLQVGLVVEIRIHDFYKLPPKK